MDEKKIQRLAKLFEITNEGLTRQEFVDSFKKVISHLQDLEKRLLTKVNYKEGQEKAKIQALQADLSKTIAKAEKELEEALNSINKQMEAIVAQINEGLKENSKKVERKLLEVDNKMAEVRSGDKGDPGKDADPEVIKAEILKTLNIPKEFDIDSVKGLKEVIERLESMPRKGGGGFSRIHWKHNGGITGSGLDALTVSDTAPSNPTTGDIWVDTS